MGNIRLKLGANSGRRAIARLTATQAHCKIMLIYNIFPRIGTFSYKIVLLLPRLQHILGAAIRAFCLARCGDRQIDFRVRIPQIHAWHRTGQWQVPVAYLVAVLCVGRD